MSIPFCKKNKKVFWPWKNGFFPAKPGQIIHSYIIVFPSRLIILFPGNHKKVLKDKKRAPDFSDAVFFAKLLCLCVVLSDDFNTLVVAAVVANAVCKDRLAALRALNDVCGCCKLPYVGTSLHLSRMRSFSLWYCHCCLPPEMSCLTAYLYVILIFIFVFLHFFKNLLQGSEAGINFTLAAIATTSKKGCPSRSVTKRWPTIPVPPTTPTFNFFSIKLSPFLQFITI